MAIDQMLLGTLTNVCYELVKKQMPRELQSNFEKIFNESIKDLSKKYPEMESDHWEVFFGSGNVKKELESLKVKGKINSEVLVSEFDRTLDQEDLNPEEVLEDFFNLFKSKMEGIPPLRDALLFNDVKEVKKGQQKSESEHEALSKKIDQLSEQLTAKQMDELITKNKNNPLGLLKDIEKIVKTLGGPHYHTNLSIERGKTSISFEPRSKEALEKYPIKGSLKVKTHGGKTLNERLVEAQKTRKPILLESDEILDFSMFIGERSLIPEDMKLDKVEIQPEPFPKPRPMRIDIPNVPESFDYVLMGAVEHSEDNMRISSEDRSLPYTFEFSLNPKNKKGKFSIQMDYNTANVKQALKFENFMRELAKEKIIVLKDLETDKTAFEARAEYLDGTSLLDEAWYEILNDLTFIQDKIGHDIEFPVQKRLTNIEYSNIKTIKNAVETGTDIQTIDSVKLNILKKDILKLLENIGEKGVVSGLSTHGATDVTIFDKSYPLGPSKGIFPELKLVSTIEKIEKQLKDTAEDEAIPIELCPVSNKESKIVFKNFTSQEP